MERKQVDPDTFLCGVVSLVFAAGPVLHPETVNIAIKEFKKIGKE
jgi:hypothetical protein